MKGKELKVIASIVFMQCFGLVIANHGHQGRGQMVGRVGDPIYSFDPFDVSSAFNNAGEFTSRLTPMTSFPLPRRRPVVSRRRQFITNQNRFPRYRTVLDLRGKSMNGFGQLAGDRRRRRFNGGVGRRGRASFSRSQSETNSARSSRARTVNRRTRMSSMSDGGFQRASRRQRPPADLLLMVPDRGRGPGLSRGTFGRGLEPILLGIPDGQAGRVAVVLGGTGGRTNVIGGPQAVGVIGDGRSRIVRQTSIGSLQPVRPIENTGSVLSAPTGRVVITGVLPTLNWLNGQGVLGNNGQSRFGNSQGIVGNDKRIIGGSQGIVGNDQRNIGGSQGIVGNDQRIIGGSQGIVGNEQRNIGGSQGIVGNDQRIIGGSQNIVRQTNLPQGIPAVLTPFGGNFIINTPTNSWSINSNQLMRGMFGFGQGRRSMLTEEEIEMMEEGVLPVRSSQQQTQQLQQQQQQTAQGGIEVIRSGGNRVNFRRNGQGGVILSGGGDSVRFGNIKIAQSSTAGRQPIVIGGASASSGSQTQGQGQGQTFTIGTAPAGQGIIIGGGGGSGPGSSIVIGGSKGRSRTFTLTSRAGKGQVLTLGSGPNAIELGAGTSGVQIPGNATFIIPGPSTPATPREL